ncbi:MAG: cytochrome c1 [Alphaproteobacteria bacterium]|nr:cytochrome c1 [Alphaproteobacteria bacterium]MBU0795761.1 cytochrome c1 [Alphaproteobacteria bacterium]MBU0887384.1 cytochrome c1 [Alphaproteobacteria bacterium]MBU1811735.1 cytochrome c1 [Alphaproteobacteria bacterium]MBU2089299.1 cytochrome c1 [Alphaproteobacteria bacterium]
MRKFLSRSLTAIALLLAVPAVAQAAEGVALPKQNWSFGGLFGTFDRAAAQRGFQVYKEVCSACHGAYHLHYRNLGALGFSEAEVKAIAAGYEIPDGPNDDGDMFVRPGLPADKFFRPFANEKAARASNGGAYPPDLSLIAKARPGGADYLYALLTGYQEPPAGVTLMEGMHYNAYFPGHQIAMAQPLYADGVTYSDSTPATIEQMARDVSTFLAWAAEPEMERRKQMGVSVILFLLVFTGLAYASMRKVWSTVKK